jgi:AAA family ATP:ADP antiporter
MLLLNSTVDATGEYILGSIVKTAAEEHIAAGEAGGVGLEELIGGFYSNYFASINILSLLIQLFLVSRIVKHLGVSTAVTLLPAISLLAYNVLAFLPQLFLVMGAKVVEKGTDYSLSNTVRNMLFLPCSREEKYSAKQAIDSFFFRMGDVVSAGLVFVGTAIGLAPAGFAKINILLAAAWLALAFLVGRAYVKRSAVPSVAGTAAAKPVTA